MIFVQLKQGQLRPEAIPQAHNLFGIIRYLQQQAGHRTARHGGIALDRKGQGAPTSTQNFGALRNGDWRYTASPRRRGWYTDKGDVLNQSDPLCSIASA